MDVLHDGMLNAAVLQFLNGLWRQNSQSDDGGRSTEEEEPGG
jgi:hypothetical protein